MSQEVCEPKVVTKQDHVCFNVTELVCSLVESTHYQTVEETYQVQKCATVTDRICDTVYDIEEIPRDDFHCAEFEVDDCHEEEEVINDVTCKHSVKFECSKEKTPSYDPADGSGGNYGAQQTVCEQRPTKNCYNVPRTVTLLRLSKHFIILYFRLERRCAKRERNGSARSFPTSSPRSYKSRTVI